MGRKDEKQREGWEWRGCVEDERRGWKGGRSSPTVRMRFGFGELVVGVVIRVLIPSPLVPGISAWRNLHHHPYI
jgi:hypothetical protein